jgi:hypothetical protein
MEVITKLHAITTIIAVAMITIFAGFIIAKLTGKLAKRILKEAELNRILVAAGFRPLSDALGTIIEYLIYTATVLVVLHQFGLTQIVLAIIAILGAIIVAFSLLLAIRDFIPNAVAGLFMRRKIKKFIGKHVTIGRISGTLINYGIISSIIKNKDEHCVPHLYTSKHGITRLRAN